MDKLLQTIKKSDPISVAQFMHLANIEHEKGFYQKNNPFLQDFITAPKVNSLFSEMIALWIVLSAKNQSFSLLELGAGDGNMMQIIIPILQKFNLQFEVIIFEKSHLMQKLQRDALQEYTNISWIEDLHSLPEKKTIIVANEFLDALPVEKFIWENEKWQELKIFYQEDRWQFCKTDIDSRKSFILPKNAPENGIFEISMQSINYVNFLSQHIQKFGGSILIIDYGYIQKTWKSTLRAIKNNQFVDFLQEPGSCDLSCFVDFEALKKNSCLQYKIIFTQNEFLQKMGIKERIAQMNLNAKDSKLIDSINLLLQMENFFALIMQNAEIDF